MSYNFDNNIPIYIQLVDNLKIEIISGILKPGERLASVRDLALKYKVNPNTMQKAMLELENLKLIYTERTNGKYVTSDKELISKYRENYAKKISQKYLQNMQDLGYSHIEIINYIKICKGEK